MSPKAPLAGVLVDDIGNCCSGIGDEVNNGANFGSCCCGSFIGVKSARGEKPALLEDRSVESMDQAESKEKGRPPPPLNEENMTATVNFEEGIDEGNGEQPRMFSRKVGM